MATGVYQFKGTIMDITTTKEFMAGVQENIRPAKQDLSRTKGKGDKAKAHLAWASDSAYEKHCLYLCLHLCCVLLCIVAPATQLTKLSTGAFKDMG